MPYQERETLIKAIEEMRDGRRLISICNFDRAAEPAQVAGLTTQFGESMKEPIYRVLKETMKGDEKLDVFLYTRGGETNAVWPIVSLLREFDADFEVLIPYRAHSSGTMLAIAAKKILMTRIAELSPIDPTTGNQFNPIRDGSMLGIAVEDVTAYKEFWENTVPDALPPEQAAALLQPYLGRLATEVHPLALGNVQRSYLQSKKVARMLLKKHFGEDEERLQKVIDLLTKEYYSHSHMIGRHDAKEIFGEEIVVFPDDGLESALDELLRQYENDFELRHKFVLASYMGDDTEKTARFVGGAIESSGWSYLHESNLKVRQYINPPKGIQFQVQPGTVPPLVPGMPRKVEAQLLQQSWTHNTKPKGVTL